MKNIVALFLLFITLPMSGKACDCANFSYTANDWFATSDFVGIIKITSTHEKPDTTNWKSYIAEVKPITIYKGEPPEQLQALGSLKRNTWVSDCDITVSPGEEYVVSISKNRNGKYFISYCSFLNRLKSSDGKNTSDSSDWLAIKQFKILSQKVPNLYSSYRIVEKSNELSGYLKKISGHSFSKRYAQYLITFDSNFNIESIKVLSGFSEKFDQNFIHFLKSQTAWGKSRLSAHDRPVKDGIQKVLGIYFYNDEKKFLSQYEL